MKLIAHILYCLLLVPQYAVPSHTGATASSGGGGGGTFTHVTDNASADVTSSTTGVAVTIPSTGSGHLLVVYLNNRQNSTDTTTGMSGACSGSWTQAAHSVSTAGNRSQDIWYCLSSTASATSFSFSTSASGDTVTASESEFSSTLSIVFDAANQTTNLVFAGSPPDYNSPSVVATAPASKGLLVTYFSSGINGCTANATTFPAGGATDIHGNLIAYGIGNGPGTFVLDCTNSISADTTINNGIVAFK